MGFEPKTIRKYFDSKLPGIRWKGDQGTAKCRWHHDRHPSLSINGKNGLFFCHACGVNGNLAEFERRVSGCNIKTAIQRIAKLVNRGGGSNLRRESVICLLISRQERKAAVSGFRSVLIWKPKGFRFRRPDGKGGWIWNLEGVVKILYRLPEVLNSESVYVAEGEKDVETLRSWGLAATCNPGGAGKWREEYSKVLKDKNVVILQDDDPPGKTHAQSVAESVAQYAADVRTIPPFPKAKDVSEWAKQGGTRKKLETIVAAAKPFKAKKTIAAPDASAGRLTGNLHPCERKWGRSLCPKVFFRDYLILPTGISFVAALWSIGTFMFDEFDSFPYLSITSPVKRCGKTRFGELLELLSCRPIMSVNMSEAALFRSIDSDQPTIIIDEAESLRNRNSERSQSLLSILQAGFRKGASVPRCVGKSHDVEKFSVYCPKAILAIGNLPDTG